MQSQTTAAHPPHLTPPTTTALNQSEAREPDFRAQASTGVLQDKQLRDRARPAARASTGWKQEDPLKHHARPVAQARILQHLVRLMQPCAPVVE